ncbi:MAG TPA: mycofactocin precursor MftA [Solirubrobacteraceae bacterium]|nr:mycofactocin precursor MftA [Solirubrobacteraceae bacterium]
MSSIPEQLEATAVEPESDSESESDSEEKIPTEPSGEALVIEDLLVEDVSIDGMCGVY